MVPLWFPLHKNRNEKNSFVVHIVLPGILRLIGIELHEIFFHQNMKFPNDRLITIGFFHSIQLMKLEPSDIFLWEKSLDFKD